jgi:hypothetical protein
MGASSSAEPLVATTTSRNAYLQVYTSRGIIDVNYSDLVYNSLNEAARRALEAMMKGYEYQSEFAKKYVALGRDQGRTEGEAHALLTVLQARGIAVPDGARERILAQKDPECLERWLRKAATAPSLAEVIDEPS